MHQLGKQIINSDFKIGILGGGQLGKMLSLAAADWDVQTWVLDVSQDFPAGGTCTKFVEGSFKNYDDVYNFGKKMDIITVEIETVNTEALIQLKKEGKIIHPDPHALNIIKDKGLQKDFYKKNNLPTSAFKMFENGEKIKAALKNGSLKYPFVQKARTDGYDGRGVAVIRNENDFDKIMPAASVVEDLVDIQKELGVIVARNEKGEVETFPVVEMEFNPTANLVEYLICPAAIPESIQKQAQEIAIATIEAFDICGLLAVELFLTPDHQVLINEVAPRPHNSGHHTIDCCITSQFQQHLRAIINLPLGKTDNLSPAVMVNLLGAGHGQGKAIYKNIYKCFGIEGAKFHIYGKTITKPFRKMGHATVVDADLEKAKQKAKQIKDTLKIIA